MAVIPQLVTSPGAVPSTGGSQVRASPQMDVRAPADASGAQSAAATLESSAYQSTIRSADKLADYGAQFADQYVKAKLNVAAADWQADLSKKLHEAEFESSKISDRQAATADFDSRVGKIRDDFAAQDVNQTVRNAVDANLPNQIALRRASTQQAAFGLESKDQVGKLITNIDQYNKQAVDSADPRLTEQLIAQANEAIDGRVAGGWLGADVAAKMKVDFGSNVYRTKIEIAMQKDMRTGIALFEATKDKLSGADQRAMAVMAADRTKQVQAENTVSTAMPVMGGDANERVHRAIVGQESGGQQVDASGNILTSSKGALGAGQITPATFAQFAKPGERIDNREDNLRVSKRITDHYMEQYNGDWQRAAVAYFSGPGNVAPAGSPTPWKTDSSDGRVKVSEYVNQVGARLGGSAAPQGDGLSQYKIDAYRYRQSIVDNLTMDPEAKSRQLAIIDQRLGMTNAIVLEQRKSAADAGEKAGIDLYTGKYKTGTFQQIADQFRATGDTSQAEVYDYMASNEAALIEAAKNPPEKESTAARLLPGAAGRLAAQASALKRADVAEARALAVQNRTENNRLGTEQEKIVLDSLNADVDPRVLANNVTEAYRYFVAAGNMAKAQSVLDLLEGAKAGTALAKLPPAEREKKKLEMQEMLASNARDGIPLTVKEATSAKFLDRNEAANRQRWENDPLTATNDIGRIKIQPFDINMDGQNLQMWATQRKSDLTIATLSLDGNATNLRNNFFTTNEMSSIAQKLDAMRPMEAQQFLAKLAVAVPPEAIALIGNQMSKKDAVSDSYSAALGLYARGQPGDVDIANRIIVGMNLWQKGGTDGKTRIGDDKLIQRTIDETLVRARAGMSGETIALQNNAIMANYVALTANEPDRTSVNTAKLDQAILEVVGKTTTNRDGTATIIPREIEPYQFRNGVAAITQADVANLRPPSGGKAITAADVRQNGQFVPAGDGKYRVRIPDPLQSGRGIDLIDNNTGKPWIVDIKPLIARGVRGEQSADRPDPMRPAQSVTPPPVPLGTPRLRPQPGGAAP